MSTVVLPASARIDWADRARGIGIILVVAAHVTVGMIASGLAGSCKSGLETFYRFVCTFHMGVFLILAGMFARPKIGLLDRHYIWEKVRTIVYPLIVWGVLQTAVQAIFSSFTNTAIHWNDLARIFYDPPMQFWFLYVLFLGFVGYAVTVRLGGWPLLFVSLLIAWVVELVGARSDTLPGRLRDNLPIFAMGIVAAPLIKRIGGATRPTLLLVMITGYLITIFSRQWIAMEFPTLLLLPIPGAVATFALAELLGRFGAAELLGYLGRRSLEIYVGHILAYAGVRIALIKIFNVYSAPVHWVLGTVCGLALPLALASIAHAVGFRYLYRWPAAVRPCPVFVRPTSGLEENAHMSFSAK